LQRCKGRGNDHENTLHRHIPCRAPCINGACRAALAQKTPAPAEAAELKRVFGVTDPNTLADLGRVEMNY